MEVKRDCGTGERSTTYNDRHRTWGWDVPCTDLDSIETGDGLSANTPFIEFSNHTGERKIYGLMEVKAAPYERIGAKYGKQQMELLTLLACDRFPAFGVEWRTYTEIDEEGATRKDWYFAVHAANDAARAHLGGVDACCMNERTYIQLLYRVRGLDAPAQVIGHLPDEPTPRGMFIDVDNGGRQPPHFAGWAA